MVTALAPDYSAVALAKVYAEADMYRDDLLNRLGAYLDENILKVKEQKEKSMSKS